ncbi:hypothetical protein MKX01_010515 [Papaver californicum]|nr:hypothetical protein MKX01_010515 [Papaver californicum]
MTGKSRIQWKTKHASSSLLDLACGFQQRGDLLGLFDQDVRMKIPVKEAEMVLNLAILCTNYYPNLRPTMSEVVDILAILCSHSNCTPRIDSTTNIADISSHNLSSTTMHYNDGVATGSSSNSVPEVDEFNKDTGFHCDFTSNVNVGSGMGTPLYADQKTRNKQQLAYAMLCIGFDANNPLPESLRILVKGMEYHLDLEYDWRSLRCEDCCTFGHGDLNCRRKTKAKKQN